MKIKNVLLVKGNATYNALNYFTQCLGEEFEKKGIRVEYYDAAREMGSVLWNETGYDAVISFNGMWDYLRSSCILSDKNIPIVSILVDHPYYHDLRLLESNRRQIITCLDRKHVAYVKKYYKNNVDAVFFPLGGELQNNTTEWSKRSKDVVFFGTYAEPEKMLSPMENYSEEIQYIINKIISRLLENPKVSFEEAFWYEINQIGAQLTDAQISRTLEEWKFIDKYIRAERRFRMIVSILNAGIKVEVYGNNWDKLECADRNNLIIHPACSFGESLKCMADCKIVLNNMPLFTDGAHDRIFNAMGSGCVCLTDPSSYLEEIFVDGEEIVFFSMEKLNELPIKIKHILQNEKLAEKIAENGRIKVEKAHLWKHRAEMLLQYLEEQKVWNLPISFGLNRTDRDFSQIIGYIEHVEEENIFYTMRNRYLLYEKTEKEYVFALNRALSNSKLGSWNPVIDDFGVFRKRSQILKQQMQDMIQLYSLLEDYASKRVLVHLIQNWLGLNPQLLEKSVPNIQTGNIDEDILNLTQNETIVEFGVKKGCTSEILERYLQGNFSEIKIFVQSEQEYQLQKKRWVNYSNVDVDYGMSRDNIVCLDEEYEGMVTLLKIDMDGNEEAVLAGSKKHIEKTHPKLMIQCDYYNEELLYVMRAICSIDGNYHFYLRYYGDSVIPMMYFLYAV